MSKVVAKQKRKLPDVSASINDIDIETSVPAFLWKTYNIVSDPANSAIISWNQDGTKFIIKKINEFASDVLPKHFKHSNYASFVRQLNMYDFHKTKHAINEHCFSHPKFQRNAIHLLREIKRKAIERTKNSDSQVDYDHGRSSSKQMVKLVYDLQVKHADLELRVKEIDRINKDYSNRLSMLLNEYMRTKDREQNLEKLMIWAITSFTPQNQMIKDNREFKESFDKITKNPMELDMQNWVKKILSDSIKNQNIHSEPYINSLLTMVPVQNNTNQQMMIRDSTSGSYVPHTSQEEELHDKMINSPHQDDEYTQGKSPSRLDFLSSPLPNIPDSPFMPSHSPSHSFVPSYMQSPYRSEPFSDIDDPKGLLDQSKKVDENIDIKQN